MYASDACRKRAERAASPDKGRTGSRGGTVRSVEEARELQEASAEKAEWSLKVRRQIALSLLTTGRYHPDDLDCLGIPPACANVIGAQTNSFSRRHFMFEVGRRKISHKAANGRKAAIWQRDDSHIDELRKLAGVGSDNPEGTSGAHRAAPLDRPGGLSHDADGAGSSLTVDPGEPSSEVLTGASEGPPALFELPPEVSRSMFDPDQRAA